MAWTGSEMFRALVKDVFDNTAAFDFGNGADTFLVALYDNDITPDQNATSANTAYNAGQWATAGNEVSDGTEWDAGGEPLTGQTLDAGTNGIVFFDGTDTPSGGSSATLAAVFGCFVYDDTLAAPVANQGVSYHYFGGTQSVTDGTFTVVWHANGIWRLTL